MAYSELYTALQNGTVDAAENAPDNFVDHKFIEVSRTYTLARIMYMPAVMLMSASRHDRLTLAQQTIIRESSVAAFKVHHDAYKKIYADSLQAIERRGVELIEPDLASFRATRDKVYASLLDGIPQTKPWYDRIMALEK